MMAGPPPTPYRAQRRPPRASLAASAPACEPSCYQSRCSSLQAAPVPGRRRPRPQRGLCSYDSESPSRSSPRAPSTRPSLSLGATPMRPADLLQPHFAQWPRAFARNRSGPTRAPFVADSPPISRTPPDASAMVVSPASSGRCRRRPDGTENVGAAGRRQEGQTEVVREKAKKERTMITTLTHTPHRERTGW